MANGDKPLEWIRTSRDDIRRLPAPVQDVFGVALRRAQQGGKDPNAKPLRGFKGAGVLEVVENFDGDTYRAVYTVRFRTRVYVLHVFQKKSKQGIKTDPHDLDLIRERLKIAEEKEREYLEKQDSTRPEALNDERKKKAGP